MTKKQKQQKIEALKKIIIDCGFKIDRYGNYKITKTKEYRIKFKPNNLRFEVKNSFGWVRIFSDPIVGIDLPVFGSSFKHKFKREQMKFYKTVLLPIEVAEGDYCWGSDAGQSRICPHFDNEGGYATCDLGFELKDFDELGQVLKPEKCRNLKEEKDD